MTDRCIHLGDIVEVLADAIPGKPALIAAEKDLTYRQLDERATRLANHLLAEGVVAGDHVAIHAMNCVEWVEALYGCFKLRAVPININFRYVEHELAYLYDDSDAVAAIVAPEFVDAVPALRHRLVIGDEYEAALGAASPERAFGARSPDDHYIVYTGGTTGMPKGVVWRQEDIVLGAMNAMRYGRPLDRVEQLGEEAAAAPGQLRLMGLGPMMHGGSQWVMGNTHVGGGAFVLYTARRFDPRDVLHLAARSEATMISTIGDAMARPIAEVLLGPDRPDVDLPNLMAIGNGGAPLSTAVREQLRVALPGITVIDSYGASETGATGTRPDAGEDFAAPRFDTGPEVAVFDDDLRRCDPGEVGMLARTGHIPLGYHKDAAKTAKTFPVVDGTRWVIPGDFARIEDDGSISVLGRGSVSINSGGEKIHPEEVEAALVRHEAVFDAAVVGVPSDRWGQQVTALVNTRHGREVSADDLRAHCRSSMADFKVPKEIVFVEQIPRTPVGKVDYTLVRDEALRRLGAG
ncbi:MAG TPA: AMP-binding protein [Acidimicrobiales bacterium]|nr:AMP-binding protein [Acidimicrobiales bacterium]